MNYLVYTPTQSQQTRAKNIAAARFDNKKSWQNRRVSSHGDVQANYIGLLGETAFSALTSLPLDDRLLSGSDRYDFIRHGLTIDVKTCLLRANSVNHLPVLGTSPSVLKCDIYVLADIDKTFQKITFVGWVDKVRFAIKGEKMRFRAWNWVFRREKLLPMPTLINWITNSEL